MPVGMYKDVAKSSVQKILAELFVRKNFDGYLQPFYKDFYERHRDLISLCSRIDRFNEKEPEYHVGDLEIAYRQLLELFEVEEHLSILEDFERASISYRRSTK